MNRWRRDDKAAIPAYVESGHERHRIGNGDARVLQVEVAPQAASNCLERVGHSAMFMDETLEGILTAVVGIDIEHEDSRPGAGRYTNAAVSAAPPDLLDKGRVCSGG